MSQNLLMCRPDYFNISYEINPWMDLKQDADRPQASRQWSELYTTLVNAGTSVDLIDPVEGLPDMVFTANAGLLIPGTKTIILSKFKHKERQGEEEHFERWFQDRGYKLYTPRRDFEGAGDALFLRDQLVCGWGFRTDPDVYKELEDHFGLDTKVVKLVDPHYYHLDTVFCPLNNGEFMFFPGAFDPESQEIIKSLSESWIAVPIHDAKRFACNAVLVGKNQVVLPSGCPATSAALAAAGYFASSVKVTEFLKSGGACKCLTMAI